MFCVNTSYMNNVSNNYMLDGCMVGVGVVCFCGWGGFLVGDGGDL